jgi:transcriptional regulator with XRE-family HTH domain
VKINQKRWGQIMKGKADPKLSELRAIATYFKVDITELI